MAATPQMNLRKEVSTSTSEAIKTTTSKLKFDVNLSPEDYNSIAHNRVAKPHVETIKAEDGRVLWKFNEDEIMPLPCPDTCHPSLWRQAKVNSIAGLFKGI